MKFAFPFLKEALKNLFSKPSTVNFPAVAVDAPPKYRGRIKYYPDKCVNCGMCIKVCSPQAIERVSEDTPDGEKITYTFDFTSCTFCGMCSDFCSAKAIELTGDYHMVATDVADLVEVGSRVKKKVTGKLTCSDDCVYCTLCAKKCPAEAITVDRPNKTWEIDRDKCSACGLCISACPKKALSMGKID